MGLLLSGRQHEWDPGARMGRYWAIEKLGEGWNPAPEHRVGTSRREISKA